MADKWEGLGGDNCSGTTIKRKTAVVFEKRSFVSFAKTFYEHFFSPRVTID